MKIDVYRLSRFYWESFFILQNHVLENWGQIVFCFHVILVISEVQ